MTCSSAVTSHPAAAGMTDSSKPNSIQSDSIGAKAGLRTVQRVVRGMPTSDDAGVKLTRLLGTPELQDVDPFLLLDQFGTDRPEDYLAGFPDHPHRGFETVTYMFEGRMRHRDNHGNEGLLVPGSVQWMSAGRGLVHSEMPEQVDGAMRGFQLWVNLPASQKMGAPRYQEFAPEQIPVIKPVAGVTVKVIAGTVHAITGPITGVAAQPLYLDITLDPTVEYVALVTAGHHAFACVFEGAAYIGEHAIKVEAVSLALLGDGDGDAIRLRAGTDGARLILFAGKPVNEPVARYGPFVMNKRQEIMQAVEDFLPADFDHSSTQCLTGTSAGSQRIALAHTRPCLVRRCRRRGNGTYCAGAVFHCRQLGMEKLRCINLMAVREADGIGLAAEGRLAGAIGDEILRRLHPRSRVTQLQPQMIGCCFTIMSAAVTNELRILHHIDVVDQHLDLLRFGQ